MILSNEHVVIRGIDAGDPRSFICATHLATWKNYMFILIDDL